VSVHKFFGVTDKKKDRGNQTIREAMSISRRFVIHELDLDKNQVTVEDKCG